MEASRSLSCSTPAQSGGGGGGDLSSDPACKVRLCRQPPLSPPSSSLAHSSSTPTPPLSLKASPPSPRLTLQSHLAIAVAFALPTRPRAVPRTLLLRCSCGRAQTAACSRSLPASLPPLLHLPRPSRRRSRSARARAASSAARRGAAALRRRCLLQRRRRLAGLPLGQLPGSCPLAALAHGLQAPFQAGLWRLLLLLCLRQHRRLLVGRGAIGGCTGLHLQGAAGGPLASRQLRAPRRRLPHLLRTLRQQLALVLGAQPAAGQRPWRGEQLLGSCPGAAAARLLARL
jgi:hypothetical protein